MTGGEASVEALAAAARCATPWKNGGGVTYEIAASPPGAGLDGFDWRVSSAKVRSAGPFSSFPGIDRTLCVLSGVLRLSLSGRAPVVLHEESPPFEFPGEAPVQAVPQGLVTDLNVMVRRGAFTAQVRHVRGPAEFEVGAARTLLFAARPQLVTVTGHCYALAAGDALSLRGAHRCALLSEATTLHVIGLAADSRVG